MIVWWLLTPVSTGQTSSDRFARLLPPGAKIIETADIGIPGKGRMLVLWMINPQRVRASWDTGADFVYGDHWFGPASLSLIDSSKRRLINTIRIHSANEAPQDRGGFAVPFLTEDGPYFVPHPVQNHRGTPLLLHLQDLTGEGVAGQFPLFDYAASGISDSSLWGYSPKSDTVVHYPVEVTEGKFRPVVQQWVTQVFATKPVRPGYWKFTWEAGHGSSSWIDEEVRFDPGRQLFVERKTIRPYPGFAQAHCHAEGNAIPDFFRAIEGAAEGLEPDEIHGVQNLIDRTPTDSFSASGLVVRFHGEPVALQLEWLRNDNGTVDFEFTTESTFAASLRAGLKAWCGAD